jgi:pimeloyl-ACP methyl ester carboxylesterase
VGGLISGLERLLTMLQGMARTGRYVRSWKQGADVQVREISVERVDGEVPATLVLPREYSGRLPAWIAIGGVSLRGRSHPQLVRFAGALASSGAAVIVPEIPEWRRLDVSPRVVAPTIQACIDCLKTLPEVIPGGFGVIGFSFGAPSVAAAASRPDLVEDIAGMVLFGGYCSLERTMKCQLTGQHEWSGVGHTLSPDPYGRWVVASNHLRDIPGHEDAADVAQALHRLASAASGERISAWEPYHDPMIADLREALPACRRRLFDCFATASDAARPEAEECSEMASKLSEACRRVEPLLDPGANMQKIRVPTQVIHGRGDRLIPFTEGLRFMEALPDDCQRGVTVTKMFAHSADHAPPAPMTRLWESAKLFEALRTLVNTVQPARGEASP